METKKEIVEHIEEWIKMEEKRKEQFGASKHIVYDSERRVIILKILLTNIERL